MSVTITEVFNETTNFEDLLGRAGSDPREIQHLVLVEGFSSMKKLMQHTPTMKDIRKTLEDINKSLGAASVSRQVFLEG